MLPCLTVPGLEGSGPDHWQSVWERDRPGCRRAELGRWGDPEPRAWTRALERAVRGRNGGPLLLAAHSLGCHAVLWWALDRASTVGAVAGALLVAPPDAATSADPRVCRFATRAPAPLPFPAIVVASGDDPWSTPDRSARWADALAARFVHLGDCGHLNAASGLGGWAEGLELLERVALPRRRKAGFAPTQQQLH
jgi:uncharacterized protein